MDKSWIEKPKESKEFKVGFESFLKFAYEHNNHKDKIQCPCTKCYCRFPRVRDEVEKHVMLNGFTTGYTKWYDHGETITLPTLFQPSPYVFTESIPACGDDIQGLIHDTFKIPSLDTPTTTMDDTNMVPIEDHLEMNVDNDLPEEADSDHSDKTRASYKRLLNDMDEELYPGCKNYSKLSFTLHLLHLKYMFGWQTKSFTMLLELLANAFPNVATFPKSFYEAKKVLKDLGLGYQKIDACENDCMLYWDFTKNEAIKDEKCRVCSLSRWKKPKVLESHGHQSDLMDPHIPEKIPKKQPAKILRYFPLIPRLKRLFVSPKTAEDMLWHDKHRVKDGKLRHPADGLAWKTFDERYPDFSTDPRNIRLGLASDGFNPYGNRNSSHSTWPVVLFNYNFPPWLCMKRSSLIMSMIIPGPKAPGDDIDIYLQPLIVELNELWRGVNAYDSSSGKIFKLRAAIMWTINDFPAYANLSGWSTKGRFACPCCCKETDSLWLRNGRKFCYMGHRRWLPHDHPFREQSALFDGTVEQRVAPVRACGINVLQEMENTQSWKYGKGGKIRKPTSENDDPSSCQLWKKRSILFDLPYWRYQLLRHNLDVMHIEKNVAETLINTFLFFDKKSKDNDNARKDLVELNLKHHLHPVILANGKTTYPAALYSMNRVEKELFLKVLKGLRVPDGYASNISRCVNMKEMKLKDLKSHDYHVLMQDILPIALRASMKSDIIELVLQLSYFFKGICAREINLEEIEKLQSLIILLLCKMEKVFPNGFFTIMIHLMIHLPEEIKLGGPNVYRWMYPVERSLGDFKSDVHNKTHPEGCIAEGTVAKECLIHCAQYFAQSETIFNRKRRNEDYIPNQHDYLFSTSGRPEGKVEVVDIKEIYAPKKVYAW